VNAPLRRVALVVLALFGLLFLNLNYVQVVEANKLKDNPLNRRVLLQAYERQRGDIVVDGRAVATSKATTDKLKYLRTYPGGAEYAPVTGFYSLIYGSTGIERAEDSLLSGNDDRLFARRISDLVTGRTPRGGNVVLTLSAAVQSAAYQALSGQKGAVVALNPQTGAILAMASSPSYDPNPLSSHDPTVIRQAWQKYQSDPAQPMLNRTISQTLPPGSTFKIVVTTAALENGLQPSSVIPAPLTYTPPQTTVAIPNYEGTSCPGGGQTTLIEALTVSCNTAYAHLGVTLGADKIKAAAAQFGIGDPNLTVPMRVAASGLGPMSDPPSVAQSSIGQRDVRLTPLQDAMVAAAVANNGRLMKPYLVKEVTAPNLTTLSSTQPTVYKDALTPQIAGEITQMMRSVVDKGTGQNARIPGYVVGGKTGTAQNGGPDHGWFIGFAGKPGQAPTVAIAVVLENAGTGGSARATTLAGQIMRTALTAPGGGG